MEKSTKPHKPLTLSEYAQVINSVNRAWKLAKLDTPDANILSQFTASRLRDLKPKLQMMLLNQFSDSTQLSVDEKSLAVDENGKQFRETLYGVKLKQGVNLAPREREAFNDFMGDTKEEIMALITSDKEDSEHMPKRIAKRMFSEKQLADMDVENERK